MTSFTVGTRGSALATAQAGDVARALADAVGGEAELVTVTTHGDTSRASLSSLGGTGVFAAALREFLLDGGCDVVVHSMKDLPTAPFPGLSIGATPAREDPRDALCARDGLTLGRLPSGARVGTGSPRRVAQLRSRRPDIEVVDIRGNIDTRLGFVASGELDAVVLAAAGLTRLGRLDAATELFDIAEWPTAPAQGVLAIEVRSDDLSRLPAEAPLRLALGSVTDAATAASAIAERSVLARLEAGCAAPVAAHATLDGGDLVVDAHVYALDGSSACRERVSADVRDLLDGAADAGELAARARDAGSALADALLAAGAADLAPLRESR